MKTFIISILLCSLGLSAFGQTENIRFTARKNPGQGNQVQVFAKNITTTTIQGILGSSNLTVCIAFPRIYSASCTISTPISGQSFDATIFRSAVGADSIYAWNGAGSTAEVGFPPNIEVNIANISFNTGFPNIASVKLYNAANGGPNGFEYNYIAPGGFEHCSYKNPFYSNITGDPLLINANGSNNAYTQGTSSLGIASVALPITFSSFTAVKKDDNTLLTWQVASEDNASLYYDVQYSFDGRNFANGPRVNALRNGQTTNTYTSTDTNISRYRQGIIYYRIMQTETSGYKVYSPIRQVSLQKQPYTLNMFPNYVQSSTRLVIEAVENSNAVVSIRDASGKMVQQFGWALATGNNQKQINFTMLPVGSYQLTVSNEKTNQMIRFVKGQ